MSARVVAFISRRLAPAVALALVSSVGPAGATPLPSQLAPLTMTQSMPASAIGDGRTTAVPAPRKVARIAYAAPSRFGQDIFTIFPDGSKRRRITDSGDARSPAWSSDGNRIAYVEEGDIWATTGSRDRVQLTSRSEEHTS